MAEPGARHAPQPAVEALCGRLGYAFAEPALLERALTHRSFVNEHPEAGAEHNERLEFLGDAVLNLVVSDMLMVQHPALSEGDLSKLRAALVSEPSLAALAGELGVGPALRMGRGEELSGGREKHSILADAFEAIVAAIYLDSRAAHGVQQAAEVLEGLLAGRVAAASPDTPGADSKTELQELVQKHHKDTVRYAIVGERGPDHEKLFEAAVLFQGRELARGAGRTKKQAEQSAAARALVELRGEAPPEAS